ncbi:hypothetical protein SSX86_023026 [Deinandra increscens subsp. villosa]|uniref:Uncharacterized protein n=1 Tax=Deinandra increscens subsp. villosa TaxID=3103831 RepID=A0AAP0GQV4_9ASTR
MDKIHPDLTVTNIKNFIPLTLDNDQSTYTSWVELFRIHCRAFQCSDHLETDKPPVSAAGDKPATSTADKELWDRTDVIVLQWIYGTICKHLYTTIIKLDSTAILYGRLSNTFLVTTRMQGLSTFKINSQTLS